MNKNLICTAVTFLACLLSGCATVREPRIIVGNASEEALERAILRSEGAVYEFARIDPHVSTAGQPLRDKLPGRYEVSWKTAGGREFVTNITVNSTLPKGFKGTIEFQIDRKWNVSVFLQAQESGSGSDMPWSTPANWEGTPMIPGMNQR
jgi:hypothetical protein